MSHVRVIRSVILAVLAVLASVCPATDSSSDFPALLDRLEPAPMPQERGFDRPGSENPGRRMVRMLGSPQSSDPCGTSQLREPLIGRLRKRWADDGEAILEGLRPRTASPGKSKCGQATRWSPRRRRYRRYNCRAGRPHHASGIGSLE